MDALPTSPPAWSQRLRVVLVDTSLPRNIGSAARAMRVMGLKRLVLVNPARFPDPEASALASGADDVLEGAVVVTDLAAALQGCVLALGSSARRREIAVPQLDPREAAQRVLSATLEGDVALVFGSERVGLTNSQLALCQCLVSIPTAPDFSSLNLASAVQLLTYECRMAALAAGREHTLPPTHQMAPQHVGEPPATLDQLEGYFDHLQRTLQAIAFFGDRAESRLMQRLRRLYQRAQPTEREIQILRGILTETLRKVGAEHPRPARPARQKP